MNLVASSVAAPTATGGTIASGTYLLTAAKAHGSNAADGTVLLALGKDTLAITATAFEHITTQGAKDERASGTLAASGNSLALTPTCEFPAGDKKPIAGMYTATATGLTVLQVQGTGVIEVVYTKK